MENMGLENILIGRDIPVDELHRVLVEAESSILSFDFINVAFSLDPYRQCRCVRDLGNMISRGNLTWDLYIRQLLHELVTAIPKAATLERLLKALSKYGFDKTTEAVLTRFAPFVMEIYFPTSVRSASGKAVHANAKSQKSRLSNNAPPSKPPYYVARKIQCRSQISDEIFEERLSDVFTFSGVERQELSVLIRHWVAENSSQELVREAVTAKFIALNEAEHFKNICERIPTIVHKFEVDTDKKLHWRESRGNVSLLQKHMEPPHHQNTMKEDEFLLFLFNKNSTLPVLIVDSPGMGKTVFLASMGNRLIEIYPARRVVFFTFADFVKEVERWGLSDLPSSIETILKNLNSRTLEKEKEWDTICELLLDALDEVQTVDLDLAFEIVKIIASKFKQIRLWVTSRPHFLVQLESILKVPGYHICPFTHEDQIFAITAYWRQNCDYCKPFQNKVMDAFAADILNQIQKRISSKDENIAGIPLKCLMIAEAYQKEAEMVMATPSIRIKIKISSIADLYGLVMKRKLEKYKLTSQGRGLSDNELLCFHEDLGIKTLFPDTVLKLFDQGKEFNVVEMLRMGVVEASSPSVLLPEFIHRTYAEYFAVSFGISMLNNIQSWRIESHTILFESLLRFENISYSELSPFTKSLPNRLFPKLRKSPLFENLSSAVFSSPLPRFFDLMIVDLLRDSKMDYIFTKLLEIGKTKILPILRNLFHATVHADCANLYTFLFRLSSKIGSSEATDHIFDEDLLQLAAFKSSLPLFKTVAEYIKLHQLDLEVQLKVLRLAVIRGEFAIVQFILNENGLRAHFQDVKRLPTLGRELLHECVNSSYSNSEEVVKQKSEILHLLVRINPQLMEEKCSSLNCIPILSTGVHLYLLQKLIDLKSDLQAVDTFGDSLIHMNWKSRHLSPNEYHELLSMMPTKTLQALMKSINMDGYTPLGNFVFHSSPLPKTLDCMKKLGADFNHAEKRRLSILAIAIGHKRNEDTFRNLIEYGSDVNWRHRFTQANLLHVASLYGNAAAVKFLVQEYGFNVNERCLMLPPLAWAKLSSRKTKEAQEVLRSLGATGFFSLGTAADAPLFLRVVLLCVIIFSAIMYYVVPLSYPQCH